MMKMKRLEILLLHHILWIVFSLNGIRPIPVQIMIKESKIDPSNNNIILENEVPDGADIDFAEFLNNANFIIDKSLFISHVIKSFIIEDSRNPPQGFAITAPSKWGKSTMIQMLKFFFSPEDHYTLNSNQYTSNAYRFFKTGNITVAGKSHKFIPAPLISEAKYNDLFQKYQGQHPVLVINFIDLCESAELSIAEAKWKFHSLIIEAVDEYEDILLKFCKEYKNIQGNEVKQSAILQYSCTNYNDFFFGKKFASNIIRSVVILLHAYFDRRVIIIIDEYERLPVNVFAASTRISKKQTEAMLAFLVDIMLPITKRKLKEKLFLLVFGIFPFTFPGGSNIMLNYSNFMSKENAYYFGIYDTIAEELMKKLSINPKEVTTLTEKFDNYRNIYIPEGSFFNPYSLIASFYDKEDAYPWRFGVRISKFAENAIENNLELKLGLYEMLREECVHIDYIPDKKISIDSFLMNYNKVEMFAPINNSIRNGLFNYFLHFGFVSVTKTKLFYKEKPNPYLDGQPGLKKNEDISDEDICIFIPNLENHIIIEGLLHISLKSAQVGEAIEIFGLFLNNTTVKATQFGARFESLLNQEPRSRHGSELFNLGYLLFKVAIGLFEKYNYKFLVDYRFPNSLNKTTPGIACHYYERGAIFEIKYNASKSEIKKAFNLQLCSYGENFLKSYPNITQLRLVLLNVDHTYSENIKVTVKEYPPIKSSLDISNFLNTCEDNRKTTTPSKN